MHIPARLGSMPYCLESPCQDEKESLKVTAMAG